MNKLSAVLIATVVLMVLGIGVFEVGNAEYDDHVRQSGTFFSKLVSSPPNEIGDTLAGMFGTLAFLAAAIAVVMQSFELKAQRDVLNLTRDEIEDQKVATQEMAAALTQQTQFLKEESLARAQVQARKTLEQILMTAIRELDKCSQKQKM